MDAQKRRSSTIDKCFDYNGFDQQKPNRYQDDRQKFDEYQIPRELSSEVIDSINEVVARDKNKLRKLFEGTGIDIDRANWRDFLCEEQAKLYYKDDAYKISLEKAERRR